MVAVVEARDVGEVEEEAHRTSPELSALDVAKWGITSRIVHGDKEIRVDSRETRRGRIQRAEELPERSRQRHLHRPQWSPSPQLSRTEVDRGGKPAVASSRNFASRK